MPQLKRKRSRGADLRGREAGRTEFAVGHNLFIFSAQGIKNVKDSLHKWNLTNNEHFKGPFIRILDIAIALR